MRRNGRSGRLNMQAIDMYFMLLGNESTIDYYSEVFEGLSCLAWESSRVKMNIANCNWNQCRYSTGRNGFAPISPGI